MAAKRKSEELSQVVNLLVHDLNNGLSVIIGRCELLSSTLEEHDELTRQVMQIIAVARRMRDLIAESQQESASLGDMPVSEVREMVV
jgi:signal transduction histidine kinase